MMSRWPAASLCCAVVLGVATPASAGPSAPPPPPDSGQTGPEPANPEAGTTAPGPAPKNPTDTGTQRTGSKAPPPPPSGGEPAPSTTPRSVQTIPDDPVDLSRTWTFSGRRSSPKPRYDVRRTDPVYAAPNPAGFYSGVSLQGNHIPPFPAQRFDAKPALLTWTGFERTDAGSKIYFQLSAPVRFEVDQKGTTVTVVIQNTQVNVRNNARRLDLRFFDTPAREVKMRRRGKDIVVTIPLKRQATATVDMVDGGSGYKMLVVQFGDASTGG
jgi:hypothetical protein